ncbi:hypothetical protein UPYG_G00103060 [Umbra pygmaea]|uniref:PH domain-containing protein n=1 Tax=Umbra pygmaea TaxID=75934 RepID=A0ABD0X175_UMBPY
MSAHGQQLLFEGFLKKRKDKMKIKWATYWFRLQNTTLFFYTKKHGSALHLRGLYYIYTVQSVREIQRKLSNRYLFEIIMKNGRRKVLAAETEDLRQAWIDQLWRAMRMSTPEGSYRGCTRTQNLQSDELRVRGHSVPNNSSESDSKTEPLHRSLSAPLSPCLPDLGLDRLDKSTHSFSNNLTPDPYLWDSGDMLSSEEAIYQNTMAQWENKDGNTVYRFFGNREEKQYENEGHYDILPVRNSLHQTNQSDEDLTHGAGLYCVPRSNRMPSDQQDLNQTQQLYEDLTGEDDLYESLLSNETKSDKKNEHLTNQSDEDLTNEDGLYDFPLSNRRKSNQKGSGSQTSPRGPPVVSQFCCSPELPNNQPDEDYRDEEGVYDFPLTNRRKSDQKSLTQTNQSDEDLTDDGDGLYDDPMSYRMANDNKAEHQTNQSDKGLTDGNGLYDVPLSNRMAGDKKCRHQTNQSDEDLNNREGLYDVPLSNRIASHKKHEHKTNQSDEDLTVGLYDHPLSNRRKCDQKAVYKTKKSHDVLTKEDGLYDFPVSNRVASEQQGYREMAESIYDIPNSLLRKMSEHTLESYSGGEIPVQGRNLLDDMIAGLGGETRGWIGTGPATDSVKPHGLIHHRP